ALDAATVPTWTRRLRVAKDTLQLRRLRLGVFLAVDVRREAGRRAPRWSPGSGVPEGGDRRRARQHLALRPVDIERLPAARRLRSLPQRAARDRQRRGPDP